MLKRFSKKAGFEKTVNSHSFRHRVAHRIIENGGTNADIMNSLGHAHITSTFPYTKLSDSTISERHRKFVHGD
jgi:integrase/recombinase XerD